MLSDVFGFAMVACSIVCIIILDFLSVVDGFDYITGCGYAYVENNELVAPNVCISSYSSKKEDYYNYIYQCNASNSDFFLKKIYSGYGGSTSCSGDGYVGNKIYYRKDGYDFNCSSDRQDCSSRLVIHSECGGEGDYNVTSFICGPCLPGDAKSTITLRQELIDNNNNNNNNTVAGNGNGNANVGVNVNVTHDDRNNINGNKGSWQVICTKAPHWYGNETIVQYDTNDTQCKYGNKATNITYHNGCQSDGREYYVSTCNQQ